MATLRRYPIVRTTKPAMFTPEKAILGLFCIAAGAGVFMTANNATRNAKQHLANGDSIIKIPIASHIADKLNKVTTGLNKSAAKRRPLSKKQIAALLEQKRLQSELERKFASERRKRAAQLFSQRYNVDRMPVASIGASSPGFTEVRKQTGVQGFQEAPRWQPK